MRTEQWRLGLCAMLATPVVLAVACGDSADDSGSQPEGAIMTGHWGGAVTDPDGAANPGPTTEGEGVERMAVFAIDTDPSGKVSGEYRDDKGNTGTVTGSASPDAVDLQVDAGEVSIRIEGALDEGVLKASFKETGPDGELTSDLSAQKLQPPDQDRRELPPG